MKTVIDERRPIKIGLLGYGFMGKVHTHAYRTIAHKYGENSFIPELYAIAGQGEEETKSHAAQYGFSQ